MITDANRGDYVNTVAELNTGMEDLKPPVGVLEIDHLKSIIVITWENMKPKQSFFTNVSQKQPFPITTQCSFQRRRDAGNVTIMSD